MKTIPNYARETIYHFIDMRLIGHCWDLAAYYAGSDRNAWQWSACTGGWSNLGPLEQFISTFSQKRRGELFPDQTIASNPNANIGQPYPKGRW